MPVYEYKCNQCGDTFEVIQKFSDPELTTHEACGGAVHRLLSAPALQFKGSGWYITDYAKSGSSPAKNGENKGEGKKDAPAKSSSESSSTSSSASTSSSTSKE